MKIALDEFVNYLSLRSDQRFLTLFRQKPFTIEIASKWLFITPLSSGKTRYHELETLRRIIEIYNKTGSLHPRDYHDITWNSSYTLALIKAYMERGTTE